MKEENTDNVLTTLEDRVAVMERRIFGQEINSKIQQRRDVIEEIVQINGQIQRSTANKDVVSNLMKRIEEILEYLELEEGSHLLGGEAKANAVLAAEPIIRQMHGILKGIDMKEVEAIMNSEQLRNLNTLRVQLIELRRVQMAQDEGYCQISQGIEQITDAIALLARVPSSSS